MAALDLTTFNIHDTQSVLTVTPDKIVVGESGKADLSAWVYKDFGDNGIKHFEYKFKLRFNQTNLTLDNWGLELVLPRSIFIMSNQYSETQENEKAYPIVRLIATPVGDVETTTSKSTHYRLSGWSLNRGLPTDHSQFQVIKEGDENNQILNWNFDRCLKEHGDNYHWWWKLTHLDNGQDRPLTFLHLYKSPEKIEENVVGVGCTFANSIGDKEALENAPCDSCTPPIFDGRIFATNMDGSFCCSVTVVEDAVDDDNSENHIYRDESTIRTYTPTGDSGEVYIVFDEDPNKNLPYTDHYYTIRRTGETFVWEAAYQGQPTEYQVEKLEINIYSDAARTQLIAQGQLGIAPDTTYRYLYPLQLCGYKEANTYPVAGNYEISECDLTLL
jgi:hypothetical protein